MRIVGIGTKASLWKPTAKQLTLPDWDQSYLEWVDLSGLTVPPFRDGDLRNYKATNTTFGNTDWTIMRDPIDLTGVVIPSDVSSFNHDLVVEVFRRASNALHPVNQLCIVRVGDGTYLNSWSDTIWHAGNDLGLSLSAVATELKTAFTGFPRLQIRLREEVGRELRPEPATRTSDVRIKLIDGTIIENLANQLQGTDRYLAARQIETEVGALKNEPLIAHVHQLDPWPAASVVAESRIHMPTFGWWAASWPS